MPGWYVDEGLARLIREWKQVYPGATVYTVGDTSHSGDPDVSQHAPDDGGPRPGDDVGEVDAGDFMPGKGGVTDAHLDHFAESLRESRDPRILYVIRRDRIFSSTVQPWVWRPYTGKYHGHTHVSVNDSFASNTANWEWEPEVARKVQFVDAPGTVPILLLGDDDGILPGWNHIGRAQAMANWLDSETDDIDTDGVFGPATARKLGRVMNVARVTTIDVPVWRKLYGLTGG
jgi:hypothetical protein